MSIDCPYCNKDTGIGMSWHPSEKEVCYGDSFKCPHCGNEIETVWETGMYLAITDTCTDGYGYAQKKEN
jgi:hypothetical protein